MSLAVRNLTPSFYRRGYMDQYGPELVAGIFNEETGEFHGGFVGDNTSLCAPGPRVWNGGIRFETNQAVLVQSPLDQLRLLFWHLARPMTLKLAGGCYPRGEVLPFPMWGGGKAKMVMGDFRGTREEFTKQWTRAMSEFTLPDGRPLLGGWFIGGADANVSEQDLALICRVNGSNLCVTGGPGYYQYEKEGITGRILLHAARVLWEYTGKKWYDARLGIWGFGQVGKGVAMHLAAESYHGARIVAVSDLFPRPTGIFCRSGIDPAALLLAARDKESGIGSLENFGYLSVPYTPGDELTNGYVDILFLALSKEEVIDSENAYSVGAKIVVPGTNSGITKRGYEVFHTLGCVAPPDFVVNMGAASTAKLSWHGLPDDRCVALAIRAIEKNLSWLMQESRKTGKSMASLAREDVYARLDRPTTIFNK